MIEQCPCATECEWLPEHHQMSHHPKCKAKTFTEKIIETTVFIGKSIDDLNTLDGLSWEASAVQIQAALDALPPLGGDAWIRPAPLNVDSVKIIYEPSPPSFTSADFIKGITESSFSISGPGFLPLDLILGESEDRRHLTISEVEMIVKVISFDEIPGQSEFRFEILDVLAPPAARAAWLEEKGK